MKILLKMVVVLPYLYLGPEDPLRPYALRSTPTDPDVRNGSPRLNPSTLKRRKQVQRNFRTEVETG